MRLSRYFMPTLRDSERGSKKRYAGLVRDTAGHERRCAGPAGSTKP